MSFLFSPILILFSITLIINVILRRKYDETLVKESKNVSSISGNKFAQILIKKLNLQNIKISTNNNIISNTYLPYKKTILISKTSYENKSYFDLGMIALQVGKALQHERLHKPLFWRLSSIKWNITLTFPLLALSIICIILGMTKTILPIIVLILLIIQLYNIVTLPIELDAGERIKKEIRKINFYSSIDEKVGIEKSITISSFEYSNAIPVVLKWLLKFIKNNIS